MIRSGALLLLILCSILASAQEDNNEVDRGAIIEQRIEQLAEASEDEDIDYTTLFEKLTIYLDFPLSLNTATADELYGLGFLSNYQIDQLLKYRDNYGELLSIYELPQVTGWDVSTARLIEPFVAIKADAERLKITFQKVKQYGKHEVVFRWQRILENQLGYEDISEEDLAKSPNARYIGSPDKLYLRYRYRYDDRISFGFTGEKDNGEAFLNKSQPYGFDFYSGHIFLKNFGRFERVAVGDFQAQFGHGLTFWSGLGFNRKSSFTISTSQRGAGIGPYTSINENLFLRGGALTVGEGDFEITVFYSGKSIDGNISEELPDSTDFSEPGVLVSSFQQSGFHRTPAEIADKNSIFQQHVGGNISFDRPSIHVGVTATHMQLDGRIERNTSEYSQFRFSGNNNATAGIDYTAKARNFLVFGESAHSANGGFATINGLNINMNARLSVNVTQRYYSRNFQPVASVGFGEGSAVENESGIYFGLELRPFKKWKINAFVDQFKFPWLRYQTDAPSSGYDFLTQIEYQPSSRISLYLRYRDRLRQINTREDVEGADFLVDNPRKNLRLNASYSVSQSLRFRSRLELSQYRRGEEPLSSGTVIYQDILYDFQKFPLRVALRYALFDTDDYSSRIYAYENDVLYFFSIPAYSGKGTRVYVLLKYDVGRNLDVWLRWAQFYYTDRSVVGSGRELINGNTQTQIKAQVRYKF